MNFKNKRFKTKQNVTIEYCKKFRFEPLRNIDENVYLYSFPALKFGNTTLLTCNVFIKKDDSFVSVEVVKPNGEIYSGWNDEKDNISKQIQTSICNKLKKMDIEEVPYNKNITEKN